MMLIDPDDLPWDDRPEVCPSLNRKLTGLPYRGANPADYPELFAKAEPFEEFTSPERYQWLLFPAVPISRLEPSCRADYVTDPDSDRDEKDSNLARYDRITEMLHDGVPMWPVVLDQYGWNADGNHRLAVVSDLRLFAEVPVLVALPRQIEPN